MFMWIDVLVHCAGLEISVVRFCPIDLLYWCYRSVVLMLSICCIDVRSALFSDRSSIYLVQLYFCFHRPRVQKNDNVFFKIE